MAVKEYCNRHDYGKECRCDDPCMVHMCAFPRCCVEIYNDDEMCERHTADGGFLSRGGPANILEHNKIARPSPSPNFLLYLAVVAIIFWAGWLMGGGGI